MADRFDLGYELTAGDWLEVNEAFMREGPEWKEAVVRYRRAMRRQGL